MHIPTPPGESPPLVIITQDSLMALQNNTSYNGDDGDIGVGNKLNFYAAVDEDYETRRAEQQAESLIPLKEDLAEWIQRLLDIPITTETFLQALDNGAALCRLAFLIQSKAEEASLEGKCSEAIPRLRFRCRENAKSRTWYARDNTANFLRWCRDFGINEGCMFESEDLVCHRQEKPVVVCLLELARLGYRFGLDPPSIIKIEKEIEREESELASQRNDDEDLNEEVDGTQEETDGDKEDEEEEKDGGEDEKEDGGEEEGEKEEEEKEEHIEDSEEKKLVEGLNGNGVEDDSTTDAASDGHKSRSTSHATSQVSGQSGHVDNDEENAERDKEEEGEGEDEGGGENDKEEGGDDEEENKEEEEKEEEEKEEEEKEGEEEEKEKEDGEGVNGTVNGTGEDENGNEDENKDSTKGGDTRPSSPAKTDGGTTSPSRKSPTNQRSRIDNIKARQLDKKVKHIASEHNVSEHVSQISEGKYCIFGRVVFIRLLKEKHLMVRVGGGWDTLDHYLSHHSPTKVLEFKRELTRTPTHGSRHDPDTGETPTGRNNPGDEKYLVISGKYKRKIRIATPLCLSRRSKNTSVM